MRAAICICSMAWLACRLRLACGLLNDIKLCIDLRYVVHERHLMVSELDSRPRGRAFKSWPIRDVRLCSWANHFTPLIKVKEPTLVIYATLQYNGGIGYGRVVRTTDCGWRCCTTQTWVRTLCVKGHAVAISSF